MSEKLLPCPFCGEIAELFYHTDTECYNIECLECECTLPEYATAGESIESWNRRVKNA